MKKGRLLLILSIALLIVSYLPLHRILPPLSVSTDYYDLAAGNVNGPSTFLSFWSVATLDTSIDGANKDVYFYITDTAGNRVLDGGRVYDGYHLDWTSENFGTYRFNFDNTMSWYSHKYVNYTLRIYHYRPFLFFLGIVLLLVAIWQIVREEKLVSRFKSLIFKKPEPTHVTCQYCGGIYSKSLDKCPHCGGKGRIDASNK